MLRGKTNVPRTEADLAVGQPERLQAALRMGSQGLVLRVRLLGGGDLDQLHLRELVLPQEALGVAAVRAGLRLSSVGVMCMCVNRSASLLSPRVHTRMGKFSTYPEAGRQGHVADGELRGVQNLVPVQIGDWHLRRGDQEGVLPAHLFVCGWLIRL